MSQVRLALLGDTPLGVLALAADWSSNFGVPPGPGDAGAAAVVSLISMPLARGGVSATQEPGVTLQASVQERL